MYPRLCQIIFSFLISFFICRMAGMTGVPTAAAWQGVPQPQLPTAAAAAAAAGQMAQLQQPPSMVGAYPVQQFQVRRRSFLCMPSSLSLSHLFGNLIPSADVKLLNLFPYFFTISLVAGVGLGLCLLKHWKWLSQNFLFGHFMNLVSNGTATFELYF